MRAVATARTGRFRPEPVHQPAAPAPRASLFRLSEGQRIVAGYLLVAYIGPMVGNIAFADHIESSFKIIPPTIFSVGSLLSLCALFLVSSSVRTAVLPEIDGRFLHRVVSLLARLYAKWRLVIGVAAIAFGAASFLSGLTSYRYSEVGISEIGAANAALLVLVIVVNLIIMADFFYRIFVVSPRDVQWTKRRRLENVVLALALLVAADGILGVIVALVAGLYALAPRYSYRMVFNDRRTELFKRWFVAISSVAVVLAIFFLSEVIGSIIKVGRAREMMSILFDSDELAPIIGMPVGQSILTSFWYHVIERSSIFYYSYQLTTDAAFAQLRRGEPLAFFYPLQTLLFRLDLLLGHPFGLTKPEFGSLMGLNYSLLVAVPFGTRPGSAPGVLGSFSYVFGFPLNIAFASIYLRWLARLSDVLLVAHRGKSLSLIGIGIFLMFLQVFFQSPVDLLILIDGSVLYAAMILAMYFSQKRLLACGASPAPRTGDCAPLKPPALSRRAR